MKATSRTSCSASWITPSKEGLVCKHSCERVTSFYRYAPGASLMARYQVKQRGCVVHCLTPRVRPLFQRTSRIQQNTLGRSRCPTTTLPHSLTLSPRSQLWPGPSSRQPIHVTRKSNWGEAVTYIWVITWSCERIRREEVSPAVDQYLGRVFIMSSRIARTLNMKSRTD